MNCTNDNDILNGRVDLITQTHMQNLTHYNLFKQSSDNISNKSVNTSHTITDTPVSDLFFSSKNVNILQDGIRYSIYKKTGHIIDKQSQVELQIIMRSIYLQYSKNNLTDIVPQVKELNEKVLHFIVPRIIIELNQYVHYKNDLSYLPIPLDRGSYESSAGLKTIDIKEF